MSANHLAQAKGLGDSLLKYNPAFRLVIGLVDKSEGRIDKNLFSPHEIIEAHEIKIDQFESMYQRYSTYELNCAMKSFFVQYVMSTYQPSKLFFLDSDILVYNSFDYLETLLEEHSILLTPHITTPFPQDGHKPMERDILKAGMFNGGFFGLRNDKNSADFLKWWTERMVDQCYEKPKLGLTVDQNWLNFLPLYFNGVEEVLHPGCNMAYWNLHERKLTRENATYTVNANFPLLFFHFSGYTTEQPDQLSRHQKRYQPNDFPIVKELVADYHETLIKNGHEQIRKIPCFYRKRKSWWQRS